jgi:hypothetical protein
VLVF